MALLELTAIEILSKQFPEQVFSVPDEHVVRKEFQKLAGKWHPDVCKDSKATEVFNHLESLREKAFVAIANGVWDSPGKLTLRVTGANKSFITVDYLKHHTFELGDFYIARHSVVYVLKLNSDEFVINYLNAIKKFSFSSDRMKEEMIKYLPTLSNIHKTNKPFETADGRKILVFNKGSDQILLRDLINYKKLDSRHVAWIVSRLLNVACYLEFNNQTINDISLDTIYVTPEYHTITLIGGWWYSVERGNKLSVVPRRTLNMLSPKVLANKKASRRTDLELIKLTVRDIFGDTTGIGSISEIPEAWELMKLL